MEVIIQIGYVTLFASAYPLASLISVIANSIEMRSDMFKLTFLCRRPRSIRCDGLNMWKKLLECIVWLSALTNCLIFGYTSGQLREWLPSFYESDDLEHSQFRDDKGWIVMFVIFGVERLLLYLGLLIENLIPDTPEDVMNELERRHFVKEEESRKFEHQQTSRQNK
jgi:anoctamin-10